MISDEAVEAAHRAICEDALNDCLDWGGRCVKAVEAAAAHIQARTNGLIRAEINDAPSPNYEEDNYDAGYIAGLAFALDASEKPRTPNPHRSQA